MTDEEDTAMKDEDALSDAEIALAAVDYAIENPHDEQSPQKLRDAADAIGYRREDTGRIMDEAAQMLEDEEYEAAQRHLGSAKAALEVVTMFGGL